ncbi:MAG TPA: site-2 protease family protein [Pyrinomonadaceae bacterium]|nr:site-2 protease family protein [Pyrinomonadaceae bacterium]
MEANIKLGRIFGIEVGLHYSWLIIALLVTLSLTGHFRATNAQWGAAAIWATAIITALLFFASIVAHELSHAAVAKANGLPVKSITLFALGGVALIEKEAEDPKTEFWMGIVGPIASAVIGFACLGLTMALGWTPAVAPETPARAALMWLGVINIALAIFNMIPGFPMDGGRVLRAIVWWVTGDAVRATRIATRAGSVVGYALIIVGIFRFFGGAGFGGLWLVFIGWFLLDAARASRAQLETSESLRDVRVGAVMTPNCPVVDSRDNLQTFVDEHLLRTGHRCFVVEEQGRISGIITPHELKGVERARWPYTTVDAVMLPLEKLHTIDPETPVKEALEVMGREDVNQLPVLLNGTVAGIITRGDVLRLLQTRAEMQTMRSG